MKDEEQVFAFLEPEVVLPEQFFPSRCKDGSRSGEDRLMAAILEDAVLTYCQPQAARARGGQRAAREAGDWIGSRDRSWTFSFERICEALELDADYIRRGVEAWKQRSRRRNGMVIGLRAANQPVTDAEELLNLALEEALAAAPMRADAGSRARAAGAA